MATVQPKCNKQIYAYNGKHDIFDQGQPFGHIGISASIKLNKVAAVKMSDTTKLRLGSCPRYQLLQVQIAEIDVYLAAVATRKVAL